MGGEEGEFDLLSGLEVTLLLLNAVGVCSMCLLSRSWITYIFKFVIEEVPISTPSPLPSQLIEPPYNAVHPTLVRTPQPDPSSRPFPPSTNQRTTPIHEHGHPHPIDAGQSCFPSRLTAPTTTHQSSDVDAAGQTFLARRPRCPLGNGVRSRGWSTQRYRR